MEVENFQIEVRYYGALALYASAHKISVELPAGSSLQTLLDRLEAINPPAYKQLLQQSAQGASFLRVLLNDVLITQENFGKLLAQGDRVILLPGISGGDFPHN
ncbi:MAG: MoaD/ThiS family protein [Anaerolineaceae bacterium]|nr:MoaD/ThiS family protein [Anaerolineaceae bacterium]